MAITGDALAAAGTFLLTLGTGAQAWANLAEFRSMREAVSNATREAVREAAGDLLSRVEDSFLSIDDLGAVVVDVIVGFLLTIMPSKLAEIRSKGQKEAAELAHFLRLAEVWGIIMLGSALALAAACIQLAPLV